MERQKSTSISAFYYSLIQWIVVAMTFYIRQIGLFNHYNFGRFYSIQTLIRLHNTTSRRDING